jgi:hypothetical protein
MSIELLLEKAKTYTFPEEKGETQERGRLEFLSKFPKELIGNLLLDEYVSGTDKDSFCYWLEFKNILFGIKGGSALKFGIYKSSDGNYYGGTGQNKILLQGNELDNQFQKIKTGILSALNYVENDRISEIKNLDIPIWNMVLQKILTIYYPEKFFSIGAADALIDLANDLNLKNIELSNKNLIEINYQCRKIFKNIPELRDWHYEKLGTLIWANYRKDQDDKDMGDDVKVKYWLYAPGEGAEMWDEFYDSGIMGLGWDKLGDLNNYQTKDEIAKKLQELEKTEGSKKNDAMANFVFKNEMAVGDVVIVKTGRKELLGYGIISSDYYYDDKRNYYKHCRKVEWKKMGNWETDHNLALKTLTDITKYSSEHPKYDKYYERLLGTMNSKMNYKDEYIKWMRNISPNDSKKIPSYVRAIEIISELTHSNIFEEDDTSKLSLLYDDLLKEQRNDKGKYFYKEAPSYGNSGFYSAAISTYFDFLNKYLVGKSAKNSSKNMTPLNQILFGPPGTGKTYNTINKALGIIGISNKGKTRKEIKDLFDFKMQEGQIIFTTFHQSMSYEDFIEGIKPIEPQVEGQSVNYKIINGIFKRACALAAYNSYKLFNKSKTQPDKYSFDDLYEAFVEFIQGQINKQSAPVYKTLRGRDVEVKAINSNDSIIARAKNSVAKSSAPLTKENMQKLYDKFKSIEEIEDLQQVQETVQITPRITEFYAVFSGLKQFEKTFKPDEQLIIENKEVEALDFEEIQKKFNAGVYKEAIKSFGSKAEPIVVIIDEINRGNISQIFGELITLIEDDKRLGKEESLEVTLPYSKDKFGVPPNLFILGTMNTADRSVEALDAALRRRFSFEEMSPKPSLIATEGKLKSTNGNLGKNDLPLILTTVNLRIEKLLDKDHQIGHSYFMSIESMDELKTTFQNKVIPLLQEYFFGDFGKIGLVLGKGFFEPTTKVDDNIFADFADYDALEFAEKTIYKIKDIGKMSDVDFNTAINNLLKK